MSPVSAVMTPAVNKATQRRRRARIPPVEQLPQAEHQAAKRDLNPDPSGGIWIISDRADRRPDLGQAASERRNDSRAYSGHCQYGIAVV